jgi:hypothetical protein
MIKFHDAARDHGLASGLRALYVEWAGTGVPTGAAGHAVVPADPAYLGLHPLLTVPLGDDALVAVRPGEAGSDADPDWLTGVSWIRLGNSRWLLRHVTAHLTSRRIGTEVLLHQQLVKGMVADALIEQLEAEALLDGAHTATAAVAAQANARVLTADRVLLRLLGASGFVAGPASHSAWASELLANVYVGACATLADPSQEASNDRA